VYYFPNKLCCRFHCKRKEGREREKMERTEGRKKGRKEKKEGREEGRKEG
jgi:hypothetical protein